MLSCRSYIHTWTDQVLYTRIRCKHHTTIIVHLMSFPKRLKRPTPLHSKPRGSSLPHLYSDFPPLPSPLRRTPQYRTKPTQRHRFRSRIIIQRIQQQPQMVIEIILIFSQHVIQIIQFLGIVGFQFVGDLSGSFVPVGSAD